MASAQTGKDGAVVAVNDDVIMAATKDLVVAVIWISQTARNTGRL